MADNTTLNTGTGGDIIASDDIAGVKFQRVKLALGSDGVNDGDVASGNPLPVDTELPVAAALADGAANPTTPIVGAAGLAFNGTTWDRVKTVDIMSGTNANNTVVGVLAVGTGPGYAHRYNPANLGTAANSTSVIEVEGGNTMSWGIGTTTTGTFTFEASSDTTNWISVEVFDAGLDQWVSGQNLTPTSGKTYHVACGGYRQVRIRTVSTLGATVAHVVNVSNSQQLLAGIDTGAAPHNFGYTLVHKEGNYAAVQTSVTLWTPTSGKRFVVSDLTISCGGTTAGTVTVYDAVSATAFAAGTTPSVFRGEFAPTTVSKPGVCKTFPIGYFSAAVNNSLLVTSTGITALYVQVNGYEV